MASDPDVSRILIASLKGSKHRVGFLNEWFPGTFTNWDSIFDFVCRVKVNPSLVSRENPKNFRRWQALKGLQYLTKRPDIFIVLHAVDHSVAIIEARKVGIPSIGIVDSNANGSYLT